MPSAVHLPSQSASSSSAGLYPWPVPLLLPYDRQWGLGEGKLIGRLGRRRFTGAAVCTGACLLDQLRCGRDTSGVGCWREGGSTGAAGPDLARCKGWCRRREACKLWVREAFWRLFLSRECASRLCVGPIQRLTYAGAAASR